MGEQKQKLAYARAQLDRGALAADKPMRFTASTTGLNRYGYSLRNDGWRLDNYGRNPVVLWMHNPYQPPIGHGRAERSDGLLVLDEVEFDAEDELARKVESKLRRGFLNAVSVGWDFVKEDGSPVLDWWRLSAEQMRDETYYDLCEVSVVTVPGDPGAIKQNSRLALARLGHELVDLFEEKEHGEITRDELGAAVRAELAALGIDLDALKKDKTAEPVGLDQDAAQVLLAAFDFQREAPQA